MKRVLLSSLRGGEILAKEIWDDKGVQLLAEGVSYKSSYFDVIERLGIKHIYIIDDIANEDPIHKREFDPESLRSECKELVKKQLNKFQKSGSISVYKFEKFVFEIINEILESKNVLENMYAMKKYNNCTYEHSVNVTVIALMMTKQMELSRSSIYEIAMGCILHDLGKIQIPEKIINKPAQLTKEEFDQVKHHPVDGYNIVKNRKHLSDNIKETILTHHEKLDGTGYPMGLSGQEISQGARICAIADVFDAMCSKRAYKASVSFAESVRTIKVSMNKQLDMEMCGVLEEILK